MKSVLLAILLFALASLAIGQTASISGTGDSVEMFLESNGTQIILNLGSGIDSNSNPATLLSFNTQTNNPDGTQTIRIGFGIIPVNTFTDQGPSKMNLAVDTSQVSGFLNLTCTVVFFPSFTFTCSPGQGGPIQIAWRANGINTGAGNDRQDTTTGPVTRHIDEHGSSSSADVQGSILGLAFSSTGDGFGTFIGTNHTHTITVTKN